MRGAEEGSKRENRGCILDGILWRGGGSLRHGYCVSTVKKKRTEGGRQIGIDVFIRYLPGKAVVAPGA